MVTDSATVTMESLSETTIALLNGAIANPLRPPLLLIMGFHMPARYANGHISATGHPIHFIFGSMVGFSGSADRMALFPVTSNPSSRQVAILDNFEWRYLCKGSFDPLISLRQHSFLVVTILTCLYSRCIVWIGQSLCILKYEV